MATESRKVTNGTMNAAADLRTFQYRGVKLSGSRTVGAVTGPTDKPIGILQNKPNIGEACEVAYEGEIIAQAGTATVAAGDDVMFDASGRVITAVAAAGANFVIGQAMEASTAVNCLISVLMPGGLALKKF
jgi:hypothetical protein